MRALSGSPSEVPIRSRRIGAVSEEEGPCFYSVAVLN
ncbi:hypothetical protein Nhal_1646 [Nitrosococcus halophilus Nc 4]|uniref:Uncharacterized protein n=1 Tax=Nitrosococcus halophilus (strain Nc4) TaxID=472759 RepID=D5C2B7_NITHN|nr:hypothetical protein Nhal_1646 [Nitrosococcus halophilus Nc 4]